jgi:hypothetical protein
MTRRKANSGGILIHRHSMADLGGASVRPEPGLHQTLLFPRLGSQALPRASLLEASAALEVTSAASPAATSAATAAATSAASATYAASATSAAAAASAAATSATPSKFFATSERARILLVEDIERGQVDV